MGRNMKDTQDDITSASKTTLINVLKKNKRLNKDIEKMLSSLNKISSLEFEMVFYDTGLGSKEYLIHRTEILNTIIKYGIKKLEDELRIR